MKLIVALCLVAVVAAAPPPRVEYSSDDVELLEYENDYDGIGNYKYGFEQSDGQRRAEVGQLKNAGTENESIVVKGFYTWVGPDDVTYIVTYVADENGYQPEIEEGPGAVAPHIASLLG